MSFIYGPDKGTKYEAGWFLAEENRYLDRLGQIAQCVDADPFLRLADSGDGAEQEDTYCDTS